MRHYYRVPSVTSTGKSIVSLLNKCGVSIRKKVQYLKDIGAEDYYEEANVFEGGVAYVSFENPERIDKRVWRFVSNIGGKAFYEPNCRTIISAALLNDERFFPSDTFDTVFDKHVRTFDSVFGLCTIQHWASIAAYQLHGSGHIKEDIEYLQRYFKDAKFIKYMKFVPYEQDKKDGKLSIYTRRAITNEKKRFALPVVTMTDVLHALCADLTDLKTQLLEFTPLFFEQGEYCYVCMQFASTSQEMERINEIKFKLAAKEFQCR